MRRFLTKFAVFVGTLALLGALVIPSTSGQNTDPSASSSFTLLTESGSNLVLTAGSTIDIGDGSSGSDAIRFGDAQDVEMFFDGSELEFNATAGTNDDFRFVLDATPNAVHRISDGTNVVATTLRASSAAHNFVEIDVTISGNPGANAINMLSLDWNETEFTSDAATLNGINIENIIADASATSNAIKIGTGWDSSINTPGSFVLDSDAAAGNDITLKMGSGSGASFSIQAGTNGFLMVATNAAGASANIYEFDIDALGAMNSADDIVNILKIDIANPDHSNGNLNIIEIDAFTGDAQATESIFALGDGPDYFVIDPDGVALGTLTWTTNADKSANTASGTIKVWINGALYHIQLYADS
jgi:hypothetical protein